MLICTPKVWPTHPPFPATEFCRGGGNTAKTAIDGTAKQARRPLHHFRRGDRGKQGTHSCLDCPATNPAFPATIGNISEPGG
jgi:hypothetical protein